MRSLLSLVLLLLALLALPPAIHAQDAPPAQEAADLVRVRLVDGTVYVGTVVADTPDRLVLRTRDGAEVAIPRDRIAEVTSLAGRRFTAEDPNGTRLFFGPTGRSLRRGSGYFAAYELLLPFVAYGATDHLILAGGTPLLPGALGQVFYVAPKLTVFERPGLSAAVGVFAGVAEGDIGGVGFGVVTLGSSARAVTVGVGYGFQEEVADSPVIQLGGEYQMSNAIKLLFEGYVVPGSIDTAFAMNTGVRFFGERLAADIGIITAPFDSGLSPFVPWLGFVYNFGG